MRAMLYFTTKSGPQHGDVPRMCRLGAYAVLFFGFLKQCCEPIGRFHLKVAFENVTNEAAKISIAICAKLPHGVCTKHPIALELRLRKELVACALVRERRIGLKVFVDVARFVAVTNRLDVNDDSIRSVGTVHYRVANATHGAVMAGTFKRIDCAARVDGHCAELDRDSKIDADFADCFTQVGIRTFRVLAGIAYDNVMAATQHHLVKTKILEMSA